MPKNILKAFSLSALMTSALIAGDCGFKSGAYAGVSAGASHMGGKNEVSHDDTDLIQFYKSKGHNSATTFAAAAFAGYGMKLGAFWAAAELFYQFDNLDSKNKVQALGNRRDKTVSVKTSGAYGANAHLGFLANDKAIAYIIAGVESRRVKMKYTDENNDIAPAGQPKKSYTSVAFVPGVGVRFNVAKSLSMRAEYKYAMHKKKKMAATAGTETLTVKNTPQIHSFQIGAVYTF